MDIIIVSPSLNPNENVSGISSVVQFIISSNPECHYLHFELGKKDKERGGWRRIPALAGRYREWKKMLESHPDAIIHYNLPLSKPSLLRDPWFIRYALRQKRKIVIHVHGGLFLTAPHIPDSLLRIMRWVFHQNVPFIALSDMEKDILQKRFGAKSVIVLPNCVDLTDAEAFAEEFAERDETEPLRIGYLGRIEPNKGMTELLTACRQLKNDAVPFTLVIAGKEQTEGEYLPEFHNGLGENFEYAGLVSGKRKIDFLRSLDVFVLPSYFEGLPMSLLETMSYGAMPIVTPVGSVPQVVKDGKNGIFIKAHDSESIVSVVKRFSEDRNLLRKLGNAARSTIFNQFCSQEYIEKLNRIYAELDR